jgi:hypothetical protein
MGILGNAFHMLPYRATITNRPLNLLSWKRHRQRFANRPLNLLSGKTYRQRFTNVARTGNNYQVFPKIEIE